MVVMRGGGGGGDVTSGMCNVSGRGAGGRRGKMESGKCIIEKLVGVFQGFDVT